MNLPVFLLTNNAERFFTYNSGMNPKHIKVIRDINDVRGIDKVVIILAQYGKPSKEFVDLYLLVNERKRQIDGRSETAGFSIIDLSIV